MRQRAGQSGADACRQASAYGKGMIVAVDCELGLTLSHGGGYPGYGSHVMLMPESGVGIFAFANRTYAGPSGAVWDAAVALKKAGLLAAPAVPVERRAREHVRRRGPDVRVGGVTAAGDVFAMNFLMDRSAEVWGRELAKLKAQAGGCETGAPITATGALSGEFMWKCDKGRVKGTLLLAPTRPPRIQALLLSRAN